MRLVLMRHGERRKDSAEYRASLTPKALEEVKNTAIAMSHEPDGVGELGLVLHADSGPARETAQALLVGRIPSPIQLRPDCNDWPALHAEIRRLTAGSHGAVAIVGHHPWITNLLHEITGKPCRTIERGEAVWVNLSHDQGIVQRTFGSTYSVERLQKKIELKMTVSTFLAGFTIPVLVELVKEPEKNTAWWRVLSTLFFTAAFCLFVIAVYMYDEMLMPKEFWGPNKQHAKENQSDKTFEHYRRLNGRLYPYMMRTWFCFFTPGVICAAAGFVLLIVGGLGEKPGPLLLLLGVLAIVGAGFLAHKNLRPELGIED